MNSTNPQQLESLIGALFDEVLKPISERMQASGVQAFPLAPDVSQLSYYVRRKRSSMTRDDFSSASCADVEEMAQRLAAHWHALGRDELCAHAARFAGAAGAAQALMATDKPDAELSPYVYAMF